MEVAITKRVSFQGSQDEFSNRYMFEVPELNQATGNALIDAVVIAEKKIHAAVVEFMHGRAFTTGVLGSGSMYATKELDGFGAVVASGSIYRECAYLVQWPLARRDGVVPGSLGRYRSLKKWLHTCAAYGLTADALAGAAVVPAAARDLLLAFAREIENIAAGDLCAPDGSKPNGPAFVQDYLEHRQFPRGRKES